MCTEVLMGGRPHQGYFQLLTIRIFIGFEILYRPQPELHFQKKKGRGKVVKVVKVVKVAKGVASDRVKQQNAMLNFFNF